MHMAKRQEPMLVFHNGKSRGEAVKEAALYLAAHRDCRMRA